MRFFSVQFVYPKAVFLIHCQQLWTFTSFFDIIEPIGRDTMWLLRGAKLTGLPIYQARTCNLSFPSGVGIPFPCFFFTLFFSTIGLAPVLQLTMLTVRGNPTDHPSIKKGKKKEHLIIPDQEKPVMHLIPPAAPHTSILKTYNFYLDGNLDGPGSNSTTPFPSNQDPTTPSPQTTDL